MTRYQRRADSGRDSRRSIRIRKYMKRKLALAFIIVAAALLVCSVRIYYLVKEKGDDYSKTVLSQQNYSSTVLPFRRGTIMDRNQTVLAASEQVYTLILSPKDLVPEEPDSDSTEETSSSTSQAAYELQQRNYEVTIEALVKCFGYDQSELEQLFEEKSSKAYIRYARELTEDQKTEFETYRDEYNKQVETEYAEAREKAGTTGETVEQPGEISTNAVYFEMEYKRVYPYNSLACTVLGFSGSDSTQGNWGIEQYYNSYLTGTNGREYGYVTEDGTAARTTREAEDGDTIITTIDYTVQKTAEDALAQFSKEIEADNVGILVMDPTNGEILGMASSSVYDLNNPADMSAYYTEAELDAMSDKEKSEAQNKLWRNFMVSDTFEPGSTAKIFTAAAALEEGLAKKDDIYQCDGGEQLAKDTYVRCAHHHGEVTFEEALAYSCNDAMMQLSTAMGKKIFSKYQDLFGLGKLTGIDLPGESAGMLYSEEKMSVVDLGTNSFGQNFTVTMVQMAAAYGSVLNGGSYYQPHVVKEILTAGGDVVEQVGNTVVRETVSESTSETIRESLELCVEGESRYCTGKLARIDGYTVGGKTGTAEKYPRGNDQYLLSFIGFTTVENPQVLVYVIVDNPHDPENNNAKIAVALEQKVMAAVVDYLNITPTDSQAWTDAKAKAAAKAAAESAAAAETDAEGNTIAETDAEGKTIAETDAEGKTTAETDAEGNTIAETKTESSTTAESSTAETGESTAASAESTEAGETTASADDSAEEEGQAAEENEDTGDGGEEISGGYIDGQDSGPPSGSSVNQ